jgi:hypothetical protein
VEKQKIKEVQKRNKISRNYSGETKYLGITVAKQNIWELQWRNKIYSEKKKCGIQLLAVIRLKYVDFKLQIRVTKVQLYLLFCVGVGTDQSPLVEEV